MLCKFHVGQKVVCVVNKFNLDGIEGHVTLPDVGSVYKIRAMKAYPNGLSKVGLWLEEIVNGPILHRPTSVAYSEPSFGYEAFRPLDERDVDISVFTKMLTPKVKELT